MILKTILLTVITACKPHPGPAPTVKTIPAASRPAVRPVPAGGPYDPRAQRIVIVTETEYLCPIAVDGTPLDCGWDGEHPSTEVPDNAFIIATTSYAEEPHRTLRP